MPSKKKNKNNIIISKPKQSDWLKKQYIYIYILNLIVEALRQSMLLKKFQGIGRSFRCEWPQAMYPNPILHRTLVVGNFRPPL